MIPLFHCAACDRLLSQSESERKFSGSGTYVGLCNRCVVHVSEPMVGGEDTSVDLDELEDVSEDQGI